VTAKNRARRRPGRPRAIPAASPSDTREDILNASALLFSTRGYAATGTREIATLVGVRQASLFHHFEHKEDLLAELLDRTVSPALESTGWLLAASGAPHTRLYLLARHDTENLCGGGHNLAVLQLLPEARGPRFAPFWAKRADLRDRYATLVREAAAAGTVVDLPTGTVTDLVFGAVEATMTWYEASARMPPAVVADAVALSAVRGVLTRPPSPTRLRAAGERLLRAQAALVPE
jgi:AcrR family transcriptional regulator